MKVALLRTTKNSFKFFNATEIDLIDVQSESDSTVCNKKENY